jgi:hypothetical protein
MLGDHVVKRADSEAKRRVEDEHIQIDNHMGRVVVDGLSDDHNQRLEDGLDH